MRIVIGMGVLLYLILSPAFGIPPPPTVNLVSS